MDDASPSIDAVPPQVDAGTCFGTGIVKVCLATAPTGTVTYLNTTVFSTDDPAVCAATVSGATTYCVIAATTITVDATLRATGIRPLVLIASDSITVRTPSGLIDVGSHRNLSPSIGAGGNASQCTDQPTTPTTANGSSGGGAGGSFGSSGGNGGSGGNGNAGTVGGTGGVPTQLAVANELRGGCFGQVGAGPAPGAGGDGGGAVFLIAGTRIDVDGNILATGEGGFQATSFESGGGGGGSGGMIGFDAPKVMGAGLLLASGGGGGGGASFNTGGTVGSEPTTVDPALGGTGGANLGGEGGEGSPAGLGAPAVDGFHGQGSSIQNNRGGGGGGGGGAGAIVAPSDAMLGTNTSPIVSH